MMNFSKHVYEYVVNQALEHTWHAGQAICQYQVLIVTAGCAECCLPLITFPDVDQVVGAA